LLCCDSFLKSEKGREGEREQRRERKGGRGEIQ